MKSSHVVLLSNRYSDQSKIEAVGRSALVTSNVRYVIEGKVCEFIAAGRSRLFHLSELSIPESQT